MSMQTLLCPDSISSYVSKAAILHTALILYNIIFFKVCGQSKPIPLKSHSNWILWGIFLKHCNISSVAT